MIILAHASYWLIIPTVIGAAIGYLIAIHLDRRKRRLEFLSTLADLRADLDGRELAADEFYRDTLADVRRAVYRFSVHVSSRDYDRLIAHYRDYESLRTEELDPLLSEIGSRIDETGTEMRAADRIRHIFGALEDIAR